MFYKKSESFEKNLYESSNSDEDDRYIVYCICEISFFYCYFSTEDTKWSLPVKPLGNLCLTIHIVSITRFKIVI